MNQTPKEKRIVTVPKTVIKYKNVQKTENYFDKEWGIVGKGERNILGLFGARKMD